ncbi:MAG: head-tail connector protein [Parvularcula sp.]|jgi:uncharacterized phiE125 gp8 family phage protein|nr:head-tail connector protein [Parvularcula sp.]
MMLTENTAIPTSALPIAEFRELLRLGTGFADDAIQDSLLEGCLRGAIAAIEARTGKALLRRTYSWTATAWRDLARQSLPVAPVHRILSLTIVDRRGIRHPIEPDRYVLEPDAHRPRLASTSLFLPSIPVGGSAVTEFDAGYAEDWVGLPDDLKRAVLLLGATYYENRADAAERGAAVPYGVATLIERYRNVRLFGGGR